MSVSAGATFYGSVWSARAFSGAAVNGLTGTELGTAILTGATAGSRQVLRLINDSDGTGQASGGDTFIQLANAGAASGALKNLLTLSNVYGFKPLADTASFFISDTSNTVANIFNLPNITVTGDIALFPNLRIKGDGGACFGCVTDPGAGKIAAGGVKAGGYGFSTAPTSAGSIGLLADVDGVANATRIDMSNTTGSNFQFGILANEPSRTTARYGVTLGNWMEFSLFGSSGNGIIFGTNLAKPIVFGTANVERVRIGPTTGAVTMTGAGAAQLAVGANGATNPALNVDASVASAATGWDIISRAAAAGADLTVLSSGTNESGKINAKGTGPIIINDTATGPMIYGTTTAHAWPSTYAAWQLGVNGALASDARGASGTASLFLKQNNYWDGSNAKYISTGFASDYYQGSGTHNFRVAASGTAGNNITWINALTIGALGGVVVGGTGVPGFLGGLRLTPVAFSVLPACGAGIEGTMAWVNDSSTATWGATITGGGANKQLAVCNATNWKVAG